MSVLKPMTRTALERSSSSSAASFPSNPSLSTNSISTVVVHGLLKENNVDIPILFNRFDPPSVTPFKFTGHSVHPDSRDGLPVPTPSLPLPPPGDLSIEIAPAGGVEYLDFGLELSVDGSILSSGTGTSVPSIPPLSMRIAATQAVLLEKEAWFYDNLQILQGSVIPRCYGLFEATLDWLKIKSLVRPDANAVWKAQHARWWDYKNENFIKPNRVVILFLERLSNVDFGESVPEADRKELSEMFSEFSGFSVYYLDIRRESLGRALDSPPGLPGLRSSLHDKVFKWRVNSFYGARKSNAIPRAIRECNEAWLETFFWYLQNGNLPARLHG